MSQCSRQMGHGGIDGDHQVELADQAGSVGVIPNQVRQVRDQVIGLRRLARPGRWLGLQAKENGFRFRQPGPQNLSGNGSAGIVLVFRVT